MCDADAVADAGYECNAMQCWNDRVMGVALGDCEGRRRCGRMIWNEVYRVEGHRSDKRGALVKPLRGTDNK